MKNKSSDLLSGLNQACRQKNKQLGSYNNFQLGWLAATVVRMIDQDIETSNYAKTEIIEYINAGQRKRINNS
jgi:hypothetical protein